MTGSVMKRPTALSQPAREPETTPAASALVKRGSSQLEAAEQPAGELGGLLLAMRALTTSTALVRAGIAHCSR
jgi:hypothetical protein